jgi:hypothetical protein
MRGTIAAGLLLAALAAQAADGPVSFRQAIVPILKTRCAGCHMTGAEAGNMALHPRAAYASLVGVKSTETGLMRVQPGEPEQSYMLLKLEGRHLEKGGAGARMPFAAAPLDPETIALVRRWIAEGAPDN